MTKLVKEETNIEGVFTISKTAFTDQRGFFERLYCEEELISFGVTKPIKQMNISSTSKRGVVRGMHLQRKPSQEVKIITCIKGEVFDVAVDLRQHSPSYLACYTAILSDTNRQSMVIPEGCAHGFQALSDDCQLLYLHTANYDPAAEYGINSLDSTLGIKWPLKVTDRSERDINLPFI